MQYCTASAAALGLSQTDLLKLDKALATSQPATSQPSPSVIWLSAQACSGCPVSLLNRVNSYAGNPYYDADMLNALYPAAPGGLALPSALGNDPAGTPLAVVNDAADLLVGDAVRTLVPGLTRSNLWADDMSGVLGGSLLDAYAGAFPTGYITLDWNATVMASGGTIATEHLKNIRNGGGILNVFVLVVDGSIPALDDRFCFVFDNDTGLASPNDKVIDARPHGEAISASLALEWLATAPGCIGIVSTGTCASYGGIPSGLGNRTGAVGVADYLASKSIGTPVINVPGCPPHPDWIVYTVAYILAISTPSSIAYPPVDQHGRPTGVYQGSQGDSFTPFCYDCPNKDTQGTPEAAQTLGDAGCVGGLGCKGPYTVGDCPIRGKNTSDDGFSMNWCVGASGQNSAGGPAVSHIGEGRHPCQGCIMPDFPDYSGLTGTGERTTGRVKGFYNE
jgi:hydrogenase small subunit